MARTARQLAALGVTMAFAISGGSDQSFSQAPGQDELGLELDGKKPSKRRRSAAMDGTCRTCHSKDTGTSPWPTCSRSEKGDPDRFLIDDRSTVTESV